VKTKSAWRIRRATAKDIEQILVMTAKVSTHEGLPPPGITQQSLRKFLTGRQPLAVAFVAETGGRLIGHVIATKSLDMQSGATFRWLADLYVETGYRRQQVGRALMAAVARLAIKEGSAHLQWLLASKNKTAIAFYKNIGARRDHGVAMFINAKGVKSLARNHR
jgi:GNAT superfamily N-acetyltransferase